VAERRPAVSDAAQERCPKCNAEPGQPCTYIVSQMPNDWSPPPYQIERKGRPTERFHNERFAAAWQNRKRRKRAAEIEALRVFFLEHGDIFGEADRG
jgi:hypothetical protein